MSLLLISRNISHHATKSGYGQLVNYLPGKVIDNSAHPLLPWKVLASLSKSNKYPLYSSSSLNKELTAISHMLLSSKGIVHYLFAENDFRILRTWSNISRYKLIGTVHRPPNLLHTVHNGHDTNFRLLDGIICIGTNQVDYVRNIVKHENVWFVPHGVDTEFFVPDFSRKEPEPSCLLVGSMLRDHELFKLAVKQIRSKNKNIRFTVITRKEDVDLYSDVPGLRILSGISDEELRNEYQQATLLLLPITDCTANNTVLEALACGLPVVTTQVGGINGYVDDSCAFLCGPGKLSDLVDSVLTLCSDRQLLLKMREAARTKSLDYSWPVIAEATNKVYHTLLVDA